MYKQIALFMICLNLILTACADSPIHTPTAEPPSNPAINFYNLMPQDFSDNLYLDSSDNHNNTYYYLSPFSHVDFQTNATHAELEVYPTIFQDVSNYATIGVMVNGKYFTELHANTSNLQTLSLDLPVGNKTVELVNGTQTQFPENVIVGTFIRTVRFDSAGATSQLLKPSQPKKRIIIYGDSISVGIGVNDPLNQAWPILIREHFQPEFSITEEGWSGRTFWSDAYSPNLLNQFVERLVAAQPNVIWIAIGTNDYGLNKWSAADFGQAYGKFLDQLHAKLPATKIYAQSPLVRLDEGANNFGNTLSDYRQVIANNCNSRSWVTFIDGQKIVPLSHIADARVHPDAEGYKEYANFVIIQLQQ